VCRPSMMAWTMQAARCWRCAAGGTFALSSSYRATQFGREVGVVVQAVCVYGGGGGGGETDGHEIVDAPVTFYTSGGATYTPHNYEGDYKGTMTLLNAFAESRNIPALKLADKLGIKEGD